MHKGFSIQNKNIYSSHPYPQYPPSQQFRSIDLSQQPTKTRIKDPIIKFKRVMPSNEKIYASGNYFDSSEAKLRSKSKKSIVEVTPRKRQNKKSSFINYLDKVKE